MNARIALIAAGATAAALTVPAAGSAGPVATTAASGITVVSPKSNAKVPTGGPLTFKMRVRGAGQVWVHVSKSKKKDSDGVIDNDAAIGRAKKKNGVFQYKVKLFDFPTFWLNTPGTYYWQAHRINADSGAPDVRQEGPVIRFKIG